MPGSAVGLFETPIACHAYLDQGIPGQRRFAHPTLAHVDHAARSDQTDHPV